MISKRFLSSCSWRVKQLLPFIKNMMQRSHNRLASNIHCNLSKAHYSQYTNKIDQQKNLMNSQVTLQRKNYKYLDQSDYQFFKSFLQPSQILTTINNQHSENDLQMYNSCWRNKNHGSSPLVLFPRTTQQVSKILKYCNQNNLAINPQSGNTGLVGGSVPVFDQIILSMKQMNKILGYNEVSSVLSCEAGCVLQKLNDYLNIQNSFGVEIPLDLGAKGSCLIGGNASTNAGGKYVLKHGLFRSHILGLEVVLPNGQILNMRSQILKDNTGYDLRNLFIGSQGTLGIITKLDINCPKVDRFKQLLLLKADSYEKIIQSIPKIKQKLGRSLNALEYMDNITYQTVVKNLYPSIIQMKQGQHLLFIEIGLKNQSQFESIVEQLFESLPSFSDSLVSTNQKQFKNLWKYRQDVANAAVKEGIVHSYDISFDVKEWPRFIKMLHDKYGRDGVVLSYGHIGDGNLHINICFDRKLNVEVNQQEIFEFVVKLGGSMSAQHGLGVQKAHCLDIQKSKEIIRKYQQIKSIFDPKGIMNPYKYLPDQSY